MKHKWTWMMLNVVGMKELNEGKIIECLIVFWYPNNWYLIREIHKSSHFDFLIWHFCSVSSVTYNPIKYYIFRTDLPILYCQP